MECEILNQKKYVHELLEKPKMESSSTFSTPIPVNQSLGPDTESDQDVDPTQYRAITLKRILGYLKGKLKLAL